MENLTLKQLRIPMRISQKEFAEKFGVPYKTYQQWESGRRNPPQYVVGMMFTILQMELQIKQLYPKNGELNSCTACSVEGECLVENAPCSFYTCSRINYAGLTQCTEEDFAALDDREGV